MVEQIALGLVWTAVTVLLAGGFCVSLIEFLPRCVGGTRRVFGPLGDLVLLTLSVTWLMVGIVAVCFLWSVLFLLLDVFLDWEGAFYFSIITLTTVGYGDVIAPEDWRILAGFAAADGFIIFGLDTAVLFEVIRNLRDKQGRGPLSNAGDRAA